MTHREAPDWRPTVRRPDALERRALRRPGGHFVELAGPASGSGSQLVLQVTLEPASPAGPMHRHLRVTNVYLAQRGRLTVETQSGSVVLDEGEAIVIPPGIAHATANVSGGTVSFLAIYDGPIDDDFEVVR